MKRILFLTVFFLSVNSYAQYFNNGQDRPQINWKKIETVNFEVIFPEEFEEKAIELARMMEKSYEYTTLTLKQNPKKISIILHTETVKSNAFLGWAPSRIEMYTTPHQRIYSQDWLEQLAIHEYRHMVQISKLETEMPRLLKWLFGEQAAALLTAAYLPFWFIEGDAVAIETGISNSGRGRFPDFHRELKTQLVEKGKYSYEKAYLGSYKDNVANYYKMGYFMVGGARMFYGKTIWEDVIHNVARKPYSFVPFDKGLKQSIGINKKELYDTVFNYLEERWKAEDILIDKTSYQTISKKNKSYSDYLFGFKSDSSIFIAEKSSLSDLRRFISINNKGEEKIIYSPGYHFEESVSGHNNFMVWSERLTDPRWYHSDRSLLRIYNIKTEKLTEYKYDAKFFSPVLSPDFKTIAVVEVDYSYHFHLVLINLETGEIIKKINTVENDFFITPSWSLDGKSLISVMMHNNQKAIARIDINTEEIEIILPYANHEIIKPIESERGIYFIGGYTGIDNLYFIKKYSSDVYSIISSRFGIRDHSIYKNEIIYSNYSSDGYQLVMSNLDSLELKAVKVNEIQKEYPIAEAIAKQEKGVIDFNDLNKLTYNVENYSKASHLFNFHSWAPVAIDPYSYSAYPGVSLMSQNMLSTSEFMAGYRYHWEDEQGEFFARYRYYGWYPVFDVETTHGGRDSYYFELNKYQDNNGNVSYTDTIKNEFRWFETNFNLNTYIPIDLSKGKYYNKIQPRLKYNLSNISGDASTPVFFPDGVYQSLETGLYMYHILNSSEQDLLPNFGVLLDFTYLKSLPSVADFGSMFAFSNLLYLPGFFANHGISLYNGFQLKESSEYAFSDRIRYPRGHKHILNDRMYTFASDYQLPLLYPDVSLGRWIYIKRMKLSMFYDFSFYSGSTQINNSVTDYSGKLQSAGIELTTDVNLLSFIAPIELGVRSSYLFDKTFKFDFLFNIEFTF